MNELNVVGLILALIAGYVLGRMSLRGELDEQARSVTLAAEARASRVIRADRAFQTELLRETAGKLRERDEYGKAAAASLEAVAETIDAYARPGIMRLDRVEGSAPPEYGMPPEGTLRVRGYTP